MNKKFVLIIGGAFPTDMDDLMNCKYRKGDFQTAGIFFERKLYKGFCEITNFEDLLFLSAPVVGSFPRTAKKFFYKENVKNRLGFHFVNYCIFYPFLHFSKYNALRKKVLQIVRNINRTHNKLEIIVSEMHSPYLKAALIAKKYFKGKTDIIVIGQDLPNLNIKRTNSIVYNIFKKQNIKSIYNMFKQNNFYYVLFSEKMKEYIQTDDAHSIVIPGIQEKCFIDKKETNNKVITYAGKLTVDNGVKLLIQTFNEIKQPNFYLKICGNGPLENYVLEMSKSNNRIQYYGYVEQTDLLKIYENTDVFVAPRFSKCEYSSYSFPSKLLDYLSTGRPVVAFKLQTFPSLLDKILIYPKLENKEELYNSILEACAIQNRKESYELDKFFDKISPRGFASAIKEMVLKNESTNYNR